MASFLDKKGNIKSPDWMKNKPFPKKSGKPTIAGQMFAIFLATILIMIILF